MPTKKIKYSLKKGLIKGVISALIWMLPIAITLLPDGLVNMSLLDLIKQHLPEGLAGLTVGTALTMFVNWLKLQINNNK